MFGKTRNVITLDECSTSQKQRGEVTVWKILMDYFSFLCGVTNVFRFIGDSRLFFFVPCSFHDEHYVFLMYMYICCGSNLSFV